MAGVPGYWMYETSGVLRPAVEAYLKDQPLDEKAIAALRAYLRQWIGGEEWLDDGAVLDELRAGVDGLGSREAIDTWANLALTIGIDPF